MSLGARTTKGGAKSSAKDGKHADKGKGTDKPQPKEKIKPQATTEQLRVAQMIDRKGEDPSDVRKMVQELMDMTRRSEEEVCSALHDADNDMVQACYLLLDDAQRIKGEWQTNEKKKKKPPVAAGNGEAEPPRDPRSRSGPRPRRGEGEGGLRGRGAGRGRGPGRGRGGGAGRGGGRRGMSSRPIHHNLNDDMGTNMGDPFPATEDWDNEEWSGSLSDTKVFTPSVQSTIVDDSVQMNAPTEDWDTPPDVSTVAAGLTDGHIPTYTYHNTNHAHEPQSQQQQPQPPRASSVSAPKEASSNSIESYVSTHHQVVTPMGMSGSLSAAQSQYLSQLTQQSQRHDASVYTSNYGVYGSTDMSSQRKQRARVPPPSKIPMSAVEMPPATECGSAALFDVQFGAVESDALVLDPPPPKMTTPVSSQSETQVAPPHETTTDTSTYNNPSSMLNESLSVSDTTSSSQQQTATEPAVSNTTSLESQLSASMKQLSVGTESVAPAGVQGTTAPAAHHYNQLRNKSPATNSTAYSSISYNIRAREGVSQPQQPQQGVYAHHAVSHHPPMYGANVYAPQVNSTGASLTGTTYPPSVTLSQYQPTINSYQQTSSSASVYGGNALYTAAAAYTPYQQQHHASHHKLPPKENTQYESSVASSNSLTSTTTQSSTAKVTTTTVSSASVAANTGVVTAGGYVPAGAQFYTQQAGGQYGYDEQLMRGTLQHHMGGYYEVGYGAREGTFGLGAGERFGRAEAASPQQVAAAVPNYAYFYQAPPPNTYQYGVTYPYGGGGSNVGGVSGVSSAGKVSNYSAQQQPPYDAQDTYKTGGPYTPSGNKSGAGAPAAADLTNAMYAKAHVALNKVTSYEKAGFHSGTPPPFAAGSHHQLYIPPPQHHHVHPQHQMDVRVNSSHSRRESGSTGARTAAATKPAPAKSNYNPSYWSPN